MDIHNFFFGYLPGERETHRVNRKRRTLRRKMARASQRRNRSRK